MEICKVCLRKVPSGQRFSDYHNACLVKLFGSTTISPTLTFNRTIFKTELVQEYIPGMSISGVQKKLSLKIEDGELRPTNVGGTFILKPSVEEFTGLSENEHLSMLIGAVLDIDTSPLGLIKFSDNELVYIIKRFDWRGSKKIQKEDMTSIFGLHRDDKGQFKYGSSYESVGLKLREVTGKPIVVLDFFNRLVYNFLIQNGDYHLKNISVVADRLTKDGRYETLAPNYDSVMTRIYFPNEDEFALDFLKNDEIPATHQTHGYHTWADFQQLGKRLELGTATEIIHEKIKKRKSEILSLIDASFLPTTLKEKYGQNLLERLRMLGIT